MHAGDDCENESAGQKPALTCDCGFKFSDANRRRVAAVAYHHLTAGPCRSRGRTRVRCKCGWSHLRTTRSAAARIMAAHAKASPACGFRSTCRACKWTSAPFATKAAAISAGRRHDADARADELANARERMAKIAALQAEFALIAAEHFLPAEQTALVGARAA